MGSLPTATRGATRRADSNSSDDGDLQRHATQLALALDALSLSLSLSWLKNDIAPIEEGKEGAGVSPSLGDGEDCKM